MSRFSIFSVILVLTEKIFKPSRQCLTTFPNTSKSVKNTPLRVVFSTLFSSWYLEMWSNTVFRVWYSAPAIEGGETHNLTLSRLKSYKDQVETRKYLRTFTTSSRLKQGKNTFLWTHFHVVLKSSLAIPHLFIYTRTTFKLGSGLEWIS